MSAITTFFTELRNDEDGASFLEYTVLLGIILAVSIVVIASIGTGLRAYGAALASAVGALYL
jgi:Flp pilus assembly pilin Flp